MKRQFVLSQGQISGRSGSFAVRLGFDQAGRDQQISAAQSN